MARLARRLAALFVFSALACWPAPITAQGQPGELDPEGLRTVDGRTLTSDDVRGKVVLLDFWATWCAPCLEELPRLRRLHDARAADGLAIVGISLDVTDRRGFVSWLRRNGVTWPQVHDGRGYNGPLALKYGIEQLPATVLFDRDGRVAARDLRGERLEAAVDALLAGVRRD